MHKYDWDPETGGIVLLPQQEKSSVEVRPVYYREMNLLGMNRRWRYPQNDDAPIMWAKAERYYYRGREVAKTSGGSFFKAPIVKYTEDEKGEPEGSELIPVDMNRMVEKNRELLDSLTDETIQRIYATYRKYSKIIDLFYVAFSGGKDSLVTLDIVQRTLPHNAFKVVFGDTQMEFPDTYDTITKVEEWCLKKEIDFIRAKSDMTPKSAWGCFGAPATNIRWCCATFKTTPQILTLRKFTNNPEFTGMAFTGIRSEESQMRSTYDDISEGKKHKGQYSYHVIFDWNSVELYLYIYQHNLPLGMSYFKGISRAGCLVCPNSVGKADFFKRQAYRDEIDCYIDLIIKTSNKTQSFSVQEMQDFIGKGNWRTRSTGRELNFGHDLYMYKEISSGYHSITIYKSGIYRKWLQWLKTVGDITIIDGEKTYVQFGEKAYELTFKTNEDGFDEITLVDCYKSKEDVRFLYLLKSTVIKAIYCVNCGVCEAECKNSCIHCTSKGLEIGENCKHCHQCHEIHEHCIRYFSLRNKEREDKVLSGIDRYASFGFRNTWLQSFVNHGGDIEFWQSEADGLAPNKRHEACHQFLLDAGIVTGKWKKTKDKETNETYKDYSPISVTPFGRKVIERGCNDSAIWAMIMVNLITNNNVPTFRWFIEHCKLAECIEEKELFSMLVPAFENDEKGHGKQNVVDSLKILFATTPLGDDQIIANIDYTKKSSARGDSITLNSLTRTSWVSPVPEVILYALYKFAEACNYYQFNLSYLMDETIDRDGISPTTIFGLDRETIIPILNGLSINYPEYLNATFTHNLETITLRENKNSADVIELL